MYDGFFLLGCSLRIECELFRLKSAYHGFFLLSKEIQQAVECDINGKEIHILLKATVVFLVPIQRYS